MLCLSGDAARADDIRRRPTYCAERADEGFLFSPRLCNINREPRRKKPKIIRLR